MPLTPSTASPTGRSAVLPMAAAAAMTSCAAPVAVRPTSRDHRARVGSVVTTVGGAGDGLPCSSGPARSGRDVRGRVRGMTSPPRGSASPAPRGSAVVRPRASPPAAICG
jgi:hypothetical protein